MSQVPPPLGYATPASGGVDLRTIATRQRMIMYCILTYIVLFGLQFVMPPEIRMILGLAAFAVSITAAVFVFMLSLAIYNTALGIVLGILTLIPLIGLFVLLIINSKATKILREHNIKVGLLGADVNQIPDAGQIRR